MDTPQFWTDTMNCMTRLWICLSLFVGIESGLRRDGLFPPLQEELMTLTTSLLLGQPSYGPAPWDSDTLLSHTFLHTDMRALCKLVLGLEGV